MTTRLPLAALALALPLLAAAQPVAQVADTKGAVTVQRPDGRWRLISSRSNVEVGDTVVTEANSTAVVAFTDGGKVALRPGTRFQITEYRHVAAEPDKDSALFKLITGGLRTITGLIGKRGNQEAYRLQSSTATIGIRGTEFTARLCQADCGTAPVPAAARVAALQGQATATDPKGHRRELASGGAVRAGDLLETAPGAHLGLVFADDSRMVLRGDSRLRLAEFRFDAARPAEDRGALELLRGAFRAVTGLIGKRNPASLSYASPTATIGIRGTEWDAWCVARGSYGTGGSAGASATGDCDQGMLVRVADGRVAFANGAGSADVGAGQVAFSDGPGAAPALLAPPVNLPPPDGAPAPGSLPGTAAVPGETTDGLVVVVHDGRIGVSTPETTLEVGKGETAYAPTLGTPPVRMSTPPTDMRVDPFLKAVDFDAISCTL
ncbi:MAG: FecR domain-containing protein [Rhodocyclaceae bacterium]|nr:FecR domain-containing protein [Rhodocyclaceae bacterium]